MIVRKERTRVVLDTNVLAGYYLGRRADSANTAVVKLWRDARALELLVSSEIVEEYVGVLTRLDVSAPAIDRLLRRLQSRATVTLVAPGPRVVLSRDPDDNMLLSTAQAGRAAFLITNDLDLLEIAPHDRKRLRFQIVTPTEFLQRFTSV